ncbi:MAG: hypothetical protein IJY05_04340 [Clostridia bacterium]|nr:hypothetical protein [Clostridia bacterium]
MFKKIKDYDSIDFLETLLFRAIIRILCAIGVLIAIFVFLWTKAELWIVLGLSLICVLGIVWNVVYYSRVNTEIEKLKKEKKEKNEGIEEKEA